MFEDACEALGGRSTNAKANAAQASVLSSAIKELLNLIPLVWASCKALSIRPALEGFQLSKKGGAHLPTPPFSGRNYSILISIQNPMPSIIRFSVREMKPSGTLLSPPTQAHFSSRLSM